MKRTSVCRATLLDSNDPIERGDHEPTPTLKSAAIAGACQRASLAVVGAATARYLLQLPARVGRLGRMLKLINQRLNISVPPDNKNSGQSLAALIAEKGNPVADVTYPGGQVGPQAREAGCWRLTSRSAGTIFPLG